jgi:ribose transport system permease protein
MLSRFTTDYGMVFVLLLLCGWYSWATWAEQQPAGASAGEQLAAIIDTELPEQARILIVAQATQEDDDFTAALRERLAASRRAVAAVVRGQPADARLALQGLVEQGGPLDAIACTHATAGWNDIGDLPARFPQLGGARILQPRSYWWPNFLKRDNVRNIANQIAVIAILAAGMTLVIFTGGIDLSVGSLLALSAVTTALLIRAHGAESANTSTMIASCAGGIAVCALTGLLTGVFVTVFEVPAFIATLAMMLTASGVAEILADNQSVYQLPDSFIWLGRGVELFGIPNAVVLMLVLYGLTHILMTRTTLGRCIYAVGGNREAARLSGVPVRRVLWLVYTACGALAGVGGVVMASQLKSGSPTYGRMYELYAIAAVVVGGTSLQGGQGKVMGTLIGAFIIAVIQNGMNLTGVQSNLQKVVLGLVILGAVLLDQLKQRGWLVRRQTVWPAADAQPREISEIDR